MDAIRSITQIPGVLVGHSTNTEAGTGCTVVVCPQGAVAGVDVRGGAPATRETDCLRPEETVQTVDAVVLSGGSAYGLAASCGVADELERRGIGLLVGLGNLRVPIVTGACLFDLSCGSGKIRPTAANGAEAVRDAFAHEGKALQRGNVGAGCGCTVGKVLGPNKCMKAGLGEGIAQSGDLVCAAIAAVNALGDVFDPTTGKPLAGVLGPDGTIAANSEDLIIAAGADPDFARSRTNTTISCVVTNARLSKAQATKVAQMAADAYAHVIRPVHTTNDGDTVLVLCTGHAEATVDATGALAVRALEKALVDAVLQAKSAYGFKSAQDLTAH